MSTELSKVYKPAETQELANRLWLSGDFFHADPNSDRPPFTIVIPPPNVTAPLHLGHALNNTLQDILIRFRRMQKYNVLWMPGTDHAGIATQTVVEKRLLAESGKRRTDFERQEFVRHVQAWKDEYERRIIEQLKAMGCSCDWQRTRFTMDPVCSKAVRAAFFRLFRDGLIYRGKRLVNWDPATQTVLADDEVEYETVEGYFWYMRYPLVEPVHIEGQTVEYVTVATTRPETMLGDTAVAMNPADGRAKYLVGRRLRLPIVGRVIPIVADEHVVLPDPESDDEKARFSTGFLKVTPAHDPDDWEIGQRHGLAVINVMAPDGTISDKYGWDDCCEPEARALLGMDRFEAREAVVEYFRQENLLEDVRPYKHEVGHSYRSHVPIEPYLSDQWYIAVKKPLDRLEEKFGAGLIENTDVPINSLAGLALKPLLDGRLRFTPQRYARTYQSWLENLRDWPISRQLWWGHRIPIWSRAGSHEDVGADVVGFDRSCCCFVGKSEQGPVTYACVAEDNEDIEKQLEEKGWQRDEDVLDTWFSSALWPFSTMGWPDQTPELKAFYPGDVLCTAREIITLWVSRMVMMGQYCVGDIPFRDVFIHAMIQDGQGRKMSKSLGNGIDPLVIINSHGSDAMRFTLASMTTQTQDVRMPVSKMKLPDGRVENTSPKFDIGRNFCNKLWNASRFVLMNLEGMDAGRFDAGKMGTTDCWILSHLNRTIADVTDQLEQFKYSEPLGQLYRFFWNDFCDWYLEWAKPRLKDDRQRPIVQNILAFVLDQTLRLLHPFIPFVTEGIFQKLNELAPARGLAGVAEARPSTVLAVADWPQSFDGPAGEEVDSQIELIQDTIRAVREIRNKYKKPANEPVEVSVKTSEATAAVLEHGEQLIRQLAAVGRFSAGPDVSKPANAAVAVMPNSSEVYVHDVVDTQAERLRLLKQKQQAEQARQSVEAQLANVDFVTKAKPEVVERAKGKLARLTEQLETIERHLAELET